MFVGFIQECSSLMERAIFRGKDEQDVKLLTGQKQFSYNAYQVEKPEDVAKAIWDAGLESTCWCGRLIKCL